MVRKYIIVADDQIKGFDKEIAKLEREWGAEEIELSDDCVSRKAVLNLFNTSDDYRWETTWIKRKIEKLPPVTPPP